MSYVPNNLSASEVGDIRVALEAAQLCANRFNCTMILLSDLSVVAMTLDNATIGLEIIQPEVSVYVNTARRI